MIWLSGAIVDELPAMITPRMRQRPGPDQLWAADNGRYASPGDYTDAGYLDWLARMPVDRCLFATAPDSWGNAAQTLADSIPLLPRIRALGYRAALVAQPHMAVDDVPWELVDVLFIGGPNSWQHSDQLRELAAAARARGVWVHMGRVNSLRRLRYAAAIGCSSADGTVLAFDPGRPMGRWAQLVGNQPTVWEAVR